MRFVRSVLTLSLVALLITTPAFADPAVTGRVDVPPDFLPRVANTEIVNMFDAPVGTVYADGRFSAMPAPPNDIDIVSVKNNTQDGTLIMGYADGTSYNIGIEGTALAMLLTLNPQNTMLDANSKRALITAARNDPHYNELLDEIRKSLHDKRNVYVTSDTRLITLLDAIQDALPQSQTNTEWLDQIVMPK